MYKKNINSVLNVILMALFIVVLTSCESEQKKQEREKEAQLQKVIEEKQKAENDKKDAEILKYQKITKFLQSKNFSYTEGVGSNPYGYSHSTTLTIEFSAQDEKTGIATIYVDNIKNTTSKYSINAQTNTVKLGGMELKIDGQTLVNLQAGKVIRYR